MLHVLALSVKSPRSQEETWRAIVDWKAQSNWMLQTKVWVTSKDNQGVGTSIAAFTGPLHRIYPRMKWLGVLDLMEVTAWQPPARCDVIHNGKIIKGTGTFLIEAIDSKSSYFHWSEEIQAPAPIFYLIKPFILLGVKISLARFVAQLE
jgi:hypothetical protein